MKVSLIARKRLTYGTRHLRAGDLFHASKADARILCGARLAMDAPSMVEAATRPVPKDEADALRDEYEFLTGDKANKRWGATRLKGEIATIKSQAAGE